MIFKYNYSNIITQKDQKNGIKLVDHLIKTGNWAKESPKFQTWPKLYEYEEFQIFTKTFLNSCFNYLNNFYIFNYKISMWVYRDNRFSSRKKDPLEQWHEHSKGNFNSISGIYYLRNLRKEGTEFKDFKVLDPQPYTWYIYPSNLLHRPPVVKSIRNRYTIAADFCF